MRRFWKWWTRPAPWEVRAQVASERSYGARELRLPSRSAVIVFLLIAALTCEIWFFSRVSQTPAVVPESVVPTYYSDDATDLTVPDLSPYSDLTLVPTSPTAVSFVKESNALGQ